MRFAEVGELGVTVQRGPTFDGLGLYYRELIEESPAEPVDVAAALREAEADVLVSYLPVGSEQAQRHYAQACLDAGVAFVNAIPVFIASDPEWARKFRDAGVPIVGDDIKSQVGSTIVHRILTRLFEDRGLALDHTYQLNFGGNMDFKNMLERQRLESKKISKTQAVTSQLEDNILDADDVHVGPSDHVPWLKDRKWAYIRMEGRNFGDVPLNLELKLEVWDSPNSAGVIIDAVRCAKLALDRGIGGPLLGPSAYFMKSPPVQYHDDVAHTARRGVRRRRAPGELARRLTRGSDQDALVGGPHPDHGQRPPHAEEAAAADGEVRQLAPRRRRRAGGPTARRPWPGGRWRSARRTPPPAAPARSARWRRASRSPRRRRARRPRRPRRRGRGCRGTRRSR